MHPFVRALMETVIYVLCGFVIGLAAANETNKKEPLGAPPPVCTCYCPAPMPAEGPHVP